MATAMPVIDVSKDVIGIKFSVEKISRDKKYKDQKKQDMVNAICALLNTNGGKVEFRGEETGGNLLTTILDSLIRPFEQSLKTRLGAQITECFKNFEDNERMIVIPVTRSPSLVTLKYNLYRHTRKQVGPVENALNAQEIMNRRFVVDQPVQLGSHQKQKILKDKHCGLRGNDVIQFKLLKSDPSKRVTLADRMTGKSNKFSCHVSAFANDRGGHIYYGIDDHGIVQGQNTEETSEIEKKVEKAIQKMIWPYTIGQPKRGEHWEIFFEPVLDEKSNPIPSTFVIVIFIAPCSGGVFTEEPESYEIVEGNVERMSFTTWKEKLQLVETESKKKQEVPFTIKKISIRLSAKKQCNEVNEVLTEAINNGEWKSFERFANELEQKYPDNLEVKLVVLTRRVMANYRQGYIRGASILLTKYQKDFNRAEEPYKKLFQFLQAALARMSGKTEAEFPDILTYALDALTLAESMEHGLITVSIYLILASTFDNSQNDARLSPDILCIKALEHLKSVEDAPVARADMGHIARITLATYYLGYDLSGNEIKEDIDEESFQKAQTYLLEVYQSTCRGESLTAYRDIWLILAHSSLYIRYSQLEPENRNRHLKSAHQSAKKAEILAKGSGLVEMVRWAQTTIASCVEELLLANLMRIKNIKVFKVHQKL